MRSTTVIYFPKRHPFPWYVYFCFARSTYCTQKRNSLTRGILKAEFQNREVPTTELRIRTDTALLFSGFHYVNKKFFSSYLLYRKYVTFPSVSYLKSYTTLEIQVFFIFLLVDGRIRIYTNM